ncbi:MAG: sugar transferase [Clostridia bacterium]|nr:sugar transferase [Clostridia bacterium]
MIINEVAVKRKQVHKRPRTQIGQKVILPYTADREYFVPSLGDLPERPWYSLGKRVVDIALSLVLIMVLAIPMLVMGLVVWCTSKGAAFYKQERLGLNGEPFHILKFRSMVEDAEKNGAQWANGDGDDRITKVGLFLRKTRFDELPQLFCILKGTMSFVGPRPERAVFYEEFEKYIHGFSERLKVKPGLTGLAQVNGGYDLRPEQKIVYDIDYIKNRSFWGDIKLILQTVAIVFTHNGAR